MERRKTLQISMGGVKIGGNAPISVESMTKTDTCDVKATLRQIDELSQAGCDIVRIAVKNKAQADAFREIRKKCSIPIECDIHFDFTLALEAIKNGADGIRLNPGNIKNHEEISQIADLAKKQHIPIRVGINSGSVEPPNGGGKITSKDICLSALKYLKLLEDEEFSDIIVSLKSSDVATTIESYRQMAMLCDYPFHLGVTAAGALQDGVVKSSIGIGTLLAEGIGDTIRVSLTGEPVKEVILGKQILSSLKLCDFKFEIISCPTCGRCQIDVIKIVSNLNEKLGALLDKKTDVKNLRVAVMGCCVNGPGEAKEADIGIAGGKNQAALFVRGKIMRTIDEKDIVTELVKEIALLQKAASSK